MRSIFKTFLLAILFAAPLIANGTVAFYDYPCHYTMNGAHFIKVTVNQQSYNALVASFAPHSPRVSVVVHGAGNVTQTFVANTYGNIFTVNIGSMAGSYTIDCYVDEVDANNNVVNSYVIGNNGESVSAECSFPEPGTHEITGCFYNNRTEYTNASIVNIDVDPYVLFYAAYNNYIPMLYIEANGQTYGPIAPMQPISGQTLSFNLSSIYVNLDDAQCYTAAIQLADQNAQVNPNSWAAISGEKAICKCDNAPCNAAFFAAMSPHTATTAVLDFNSLYQGSVMSEEYNITGANFSYTGNFGGGMSLIVPYGTYTICHTLVTSEGESCHKCITLCYYNGEEGPDAPLKPGAKLLNNNNSTVLSVMETNSTVNVLLQSSMEGTGSYEIYNGQGQLIYKSSTLTIGKGKNIWQYDASTYARGMYFIRFNTDGVGINTEKVILK